MKTIAAVLLMGALMTTATAARAAGEDWKAKFLKASDEYFDQVYLPYDPANATMVGYHQFDGKLVNYSHQSIEAQIDDLKKFLVRMEGIRKRRTSEAIDAQRELFWHLSVFMDAVAASKPGSNAVIFTINIDADGVYKIKWIKAHDPLLSEAEIQKAREALLDLHPKVHAARMLPGDRDVVVQVGRHEDRFDPVLADLDIVEANIRTQLLTLETIRPWEKNPDNYSSACANAAFVLMERKFAPPEDRLSSLISRERDMPVLLANARANLKNPPHIYTEIAIEQLPGITSFFEHDVPLAFAGVKDEKLNAEFKSSNAAVIAALNDYLKWLKTDLLARSNGDYRIGADTFRKKLANDEMVDLPLEKLLEIGWADLRKNQQQFNTIAKELEPAKDPRMVLEELGANHPAPDRLLDAFRATFDSLIAFIRTNHIVTIPSDVRPILEETPPFMRATTTASMDTPGPFEPHATEAYFNVTLPDPSMKPEEVEGFMHSFNIGTVISTAVHEAYPGHYIQFLWVPSAPSRVRKMLGANTNVEGWAHYCEQMMLDAGYGQPGQGAKDEREAKFLRLGQLQDALLRNARFIVGIQMHTGAMSFDQAVEFFQKEGYQSKELALVETKRGTSDPTYLYYTLGKLQIMKLREDLKAKQGAAFSLEQFHNSFLKQGFPPIKIVRQTLLGDNSPTL